MIEVWDGCPLPTQLPPTPGDLSGAVSIFYSFNWLSGLSLSLEQDENWEDWETTSSGSDQKERYIYVKSNISD